MDPSTFQLLSALNLLVFGTLFISSGATSFLALAAIIELGLGSILKLSGYHCKDAWDPKDIIPFYKGKK